MSLHDHYAAGRRWVFSQDRGKNFDLGLWRPIVNGWNLVEEALAEVFDLSIQTASGVYRG